MASTLTLLFTALLILTTAIKLWLGRRHIRHIVAHRIAVPAAFSQTISIEAHQKAADYSAAKTRLMLSESVAQAVLLAALTLGGGLELIDSLWRDALANHEILRGAAVILSAMIVSSLVELPFDYYKAFAVDQR